MLSIRKVRLLITSRYIAMQSYECVIISTMFLIYFISYGCNDSALVFLGGAEASASPSFALPMFITIKKIIILHLFLGVPAATVGGTGTPWHTRGYAPDSKDIDGYICVLFEEDMLFSQETMRMVIKEIDPEGVELRRARRLRICHNATTRWDPG